MVEENQLIHENERKCNKSNTKTALERFLYLPIVLLYLQTSKHVIEYLQYKYVPNFLFFFRCQILGRIWDESLESFPPCYSQSPLY
jgi:hypothetical protein